MMADNGMKDIQALIPIVGSGEGCQCGRGHTTILFRRKNLRMGDMKQNTHTHTHTEAQRMSIFIYKATVTK